MSYKDKDEVYAERKCKYNVIKRNQEDEKEKNTVMMKKIVKTLMMTFMCAMIVMSNAHAADISFKFSLGNTGQNYNRVSDKANKKTILSDPWTIKITSINSVGNYGVSFCPYKTASKRVCKKSSVWINTIKSKTVAYASGDAALGFYKVCARQDDEYFMTFKASGKFNSDKTY